MLKYGFVKFYRSFTQWGWYHNSITFHVFFHLILTANYEDKAFEGIVVKRGQRIISIANLAEELGLSVRNIRTALSHLKATGDISVNACSRYSLVTILHYNEFQEMTGSATSEQTESDRF